MKIGIVIAIARELKAFLDSNYKVDIIEVNNHEIYKTIINNNEVYAIKSGYGKIDASAATQLLITKFDCEVIVNFGVTGALDPSLKVNDLFVVNKTCNYDYDVSPIDPVKLHQYEEFKDEYIPLDKSMIDFAKKYDKALVDATVASGDAFIIDKNIKKKFFNELKCNICDMEIAGIARTCYINKVKCLSIKCISDTYDGDGSDFNKNVTNSAAKAFKLIDVLLNNM